MNKTVFVRGTALYLTAVIAAFAFSSCSSKPKAEGSGTAGTTHTTQAGAEDSSDTGEESSVDTTAAEGETTGGSGDSGATGSSSATQGPAGSTSGHTATTSASANPRYAFYQNLIQNESQWLVSLQLDNGSFPMTATKDGTVKVSPYFSDFAALALLEAGNKYAEPVRKYMDWHFAHINTAEQDYNQVDGTIYDYNENVADTHHAVSESYIDNKKSYDSTDSYAATFLSVLWHYYSATGDAAYITSHADTIDRIVNALFSTMDNGLTWAKPDYKIKYLMDNCEVYQGLSDASRLYSQALSGRTDKLNQINGGKDSVQGKIGTLWTDGQDGHYFSYAGQGGFSWNTFYADATCQVFVITNGVVSPDSDRAKLVYNNFNKYWSTGAASHSWEKFDTTDSFYWGELAYAAALMGDVGRVDTYMDFYMKYPGKNHNYPLYNADCAKVVRAAYLMLNYYR